MRVVLVLAFGALACCAIEQYAGQRNAFVPLMTDQWECTASHREPVLPGKLITKDVCDAYARKGRGK